VVVLADHTKWDVAGLCTIAPLEAASVVVSDDALDADAHSVLTERVERLTIASSDAYRHGHGRSA